MSFAYRLQVYRDSHELKRGTAWFVRADLVVTAFHVVSDDAGVWLHERDPTVQYRLELADQEAVALQAVTADKAVDIALLRFDSPGREVNILELAGDSLATLRLKKESDRLQRQWELLNEKLSGLTEERIRETRFEEKLRLKKLIDDTQAERDRVEEQLKDLESGGLVDGILTQVAEGALRALLNAIPEARPLLTPSRTEWVRTILQELASPNVRGIALLEPLHFGACDIVKQVIARLQQAGGPALVIRLVPNPHTTDERRLYSALCRDVRHGLEAALGRPLPAEWRSGFDLSGGADPCAHLDSEGFELLLTGLLEGPISRSQRYLLLSVEGLSRIAEEHLKNWAWLMSRLLGSYPLKLLVWGGRELHELCSGAKSIEGFSPFQRLRQRRVPPFSATEVTDLVTRQWGQPTGAATLYELTHGHPALVNELLEQAAVELGGNNVSYPYQGGVAWMERSLRSAIQVSSAMKRHFQATGRRGCRRSQVESARQRAYTTSHSG